MKKLLITLAVTLLAAQANAQSGAAAEAAAAAKAAATAARTVGTGAKASTSLGTSGAAAGAASRSTPATSLLSSKSAVNAAPSCTTSLLGGVDISKAIARGVARKNSACATKIDSAAAKDTAGLILEAAANDLRGEGANPSVAKRGHALHESAELLEKRNSLSDAQAEENVAQIVKNCDMYTDAMSSDDVVNAMRKVD